MYVNWLSRRTIVAGMTAPTEHNHPIISIRLWLCMYVSTFLQQRLRGGRKRQTCVCVCARACTSVYLCIYVVLSHFNHTEQDLDLLSGVLELDFFLPDLDETVHVLLSEAAQLNQDETSNPPPPLVTGTVNTPQQMEEFQTRTERVCHYFFCFIWK